MYTSALPGESGGQNGKISPYAIFVPWLSVQQKKQNKFLMYKHEMILHSWPCKLVLYACRGQMPIAVQSSGYGLVAQNMQKDMRGTRCTSSPYMGNALVLHRFLSSTGITVLQVNCQIKKVMEVHCTQESTVQETEKKIGQTRLCTCSSYSARASCSSATSFS